MSKIRVVSWDVDGTLYSLARLKLLMTFSASWITLGRIRDLHEWIDLQRSRDGGSLDRAGWEAWGDVFEKEKAIFARILPRLPLKRGVRERLEEYRLAGVPQVTLSDLPAAYKLEALGVSEYFQASFCSVEIGHWKPSPIPFRAIQERFGVAPHEHLHIGDRLISDGAGAAAAGCQFLHLK